MSDSKYVNLILFFLILMAVLTASLMYFSQKIDFTAVKKTAAERAEKEPGTIPVYDRSGETIVYTVSMGVIPLGEAVFSSLPNIREDGREEAVMTFETKLKTFWDKETIYSDAVTLMPLRVEREIKNLLKQERITEQYNHDVFTLTVTKKNGNNKKSSETVFKKDSPIHNPILLPHYVRWVFKDLQIGQSITANLPKRALEIKLVSIEEIKIKAGTFKTYHFTSEPKQIEIWLSMDKNRVPVKLQGIGIFPYVLEMSRYDPPQKLQEKPVTKE